MTDMNNTPNQVPQDPQPQMPLQPEASRPAIPTGAPVQTPPAPGFMPPAGQMPPQQPVPQQPMPGMPLMELTGAMKIAWAAVGFLLGPAGILIAWLVNVNSYPAVKSGAVKFSVIGCVVTLVLAALLGILLAFGMFAATEMLYYY